MSTATPPFDAKAVREALRVTNDDAIAAQMFPLSADVPVDFQQVGTRLRMRRRGDVDPISSASLILNDEGVLLWHGESALIDSSRRRMRRGLPEAPDGELIELYQFQTLAPNEITGHLIGLDARLNNNLTDKDHCTPRLVVLNRDDATGKVTRGANATPTGKKRRLLFVHGTFSKTEALLDGIAAASNGTAFFEAAFNHYEEVLAFDHATLSVGPILNAFDLSRLLQGISGPLDVIAHSRGGLVARWAIEGFGMGGKGPVSAVLVGCPIAGTSLASPPRLRASLSLLSNIGMAMKLAGGLASVYMPLLIAPLTLLRVATSVVTVSSKTPLIDAAVQMIPGLAGQSRVGNNPELGRLRSLSLAAPPKYYVVQSNYETEAVGWKFWRWFRKDKLADAAADRIFEGHNDLVVDTSSMTDFSNHANFPAPGLHDFKRSSKVHHCNYFEDASTLDFIRASLSF